MGRVTHHEPGPTPGTIGPLSVTVPALPRRRSPAAVVVPALAALGAADALGGVFGGSVFSAMVCRGEEKKKEC